MTEIIKSRIEAIKKGELPDGYQRTKAGIMPDDWDGNVRAKQLFKSHTDKKHNGDLEILASTQERGIVPRNQIGIDIQCSDEGVKGYKKVSKGDFVISLRSFQGGIEYSEYDGIVSPAYTVLKPTKDISTGFYKNYFKTDSFIDRLNGAVYGIRDGKQIGYEDFGDMYVHYPPLAEQERIAEIFAQCDKVIELNQRKIDELKKLKKTCLLQMFPKQGQDTPFIRFGGYYDEWNRYAFGEIYTERNENGHSALPILTVSIHNGVSNGELDSDGLGKKVKRSEDRSLYKHVYRGDLILNMMRAWQGAIGVAKCEGMVSPAYITAIPNDYVYPPFMNYYVKTTEIINQINTLSYGVTDFRKRIYWDSFVRVICKLPSIEEQKVIADYFSSLDRLIDLSQQELEQKQAVKNALMQLLLTGIVRTKA